MRGLDKISRDSWMEAAATPPMTVMLSWMGHPAKTPPPTAEVATNPLIAFLNYVELLQRHRLKGQRLASNLLTADLTCDTITLAEEFAQTYLVPPLESLRGWLA